MSNHRIWDRRTFVSASLSVLLATGLTLSVCAAKGDLNTSTPSAASTPVQRHVGTLAPASCIASGLADSPKG